MGLTIGSHSSGYYSKPLTCSKRDCVLVDSVLGKKSVLGAKIKINFLKKKRLLKTKVMSTAKPGE